MIASTTASMLNFNWAETGMMGARRAVVPVRMLAVRMGVVGSGSDAGRRCNGKQHHW